MHTTAKVNIELRQANIRTFRSHIKPLQRPKLTGVYFAHWRGYVKIGYANDIVARVRAIEDGIPEGEVTGLGWIPAPDGNPGRIEQCIHRSLTSLRHRGEWFRDAPELRAILARHGMPWPER